MKKKENDKDEDIKEEEREPKDRRCFQCGDMGHVRRDCPEYRHLKQRTTGAPGIDKIRLTYFEDELKVASASAYLASYSSSATHMVRTIVSSQSIPIPQTAADCPGRTRQPSECVSMKVRLYTWVRSSALIKNIHTFSYLYLPPSKYKGSE